ncbi:unnamed protein product [Hapterophycus canaliculatus]
MTWCCSPLPPLLLFPTLSSGLFPAVAHCHIFGHSDTGMMMNFEIFEEL